MSDSPRVPRRAVWTEWESDRVRTAPRPAAHCPPAHLRTPRPPIVCTVTITTIRPRSLLPMCEHSHKARLRLAFSSLPSTGRAIAIVHHHAGPNRRSPTRDPPHHTTDPYKSTIGSTANIHNRHHKLTTVILSHFFFFYIFYCFWHFTI